MMTRKELDKFYTRPDIARMFVDRVSDLVDLSEFDLIIEPSAGSGNILRFLPEGTLGLDLEPEGEGILQQDFFEYVSPYHPLTNNIKIATIGNPPFGTGYMNPLAKRFFNHAATFSDVIAFIVPAKWHTSWKVQKGLNKDFGLYFSELLPKNSFTLGDMPYDVNCCMQVWSKMPLGTNLRIVDAPPTKHEDFDMFLMCDNVVRRKTVQEQIRNREYWDFGLKYWGNIRICEIEMISDTSTTHYVFASRKPYVRKIFESIDWNDYVSNMGAPNVGGKSIIVKAYSDAKKKFIL